GLLVELDRTAGVLEVLVDLAGAAHTADRIDQFHRGTADGLMHATLESCLVVEERRVVPIDAEEAQLVQQHPRYTGVLIDVEVDQIGRDRDDARRRAGPDLAFATLVGDLLVRPRWRSKGVGLGVTRIEVGPALRRPDEIGIEPDYPDDDDAQHR